MTKTTPQAKGSSFVTDETTPKFKVRKVAVEKAAPPGRRPIPVILSDPDALHCSVCHEPLTIPISQCSNGHVSCHCCAATNSSCPSCSGKMIVDRHCRAVERILKSVMIRCSFKINDCEATISYCSKGSHEAACLYAPRPCPFIACGFDCVLMSLPAHFIQERKNCVVSFDFNLSFTFSFKTEEGFRVLQEKTDGTTFMFVYSDELLFVKSFGNPASGESRFDYVLTIEGWSGTLIFQSFTGKVDGNPIQSPFVGYLRVPEYLFDSEGCIRVDVFISKCLFVLLVWTLGHGSSF